RIKPEPSLIRRRIHVERKQRDHDVEAKALPHLGEKERKQATGMMREQICLRWRAGRRSRITELAARRKRKRRGLRAFRLSGSPFLVASVFATILLSLSSVSPMRKRGMFENLAGASGSGRIAEDHSSCPKPSSTLPSSRKRATVI